MWCYQMAVSRRIVTSLLENDNYTELGFRLKVESKGVPPQKLQPSYEGSASIGAVVMRLIVQHYGPDTFG